MKVPFALLLLLPMVAQSQAINVTPGGSQIMGAAGVQTNFQYKGRFGWNGIGYYNGKLSISGYVNTPLRMFTSEDASKDKYRLGIGDHELDDSLPVDEFDYHRAPLRGVSLFMHTKKSDLQVAIGSFSADDQLPYMYSIYQINPDVIGSIIQSIKVSDRTSLQSYNVFGRSSSTSIQSLSWKPAKYFSWATSEGMGSNRLYFANAAEYRRKDLTLRASYTVAKNSFHRQDGTYDIEPLGFNGKADIPIGENAKLMFSHRHELTVIPKYLGLQRNSAIGTMDFAGATASFFKFRMSANVTSSSSNFFIGKENSGQASVSRLIMPRWKSTFSYLHNVMSVSDIEVYQNTNELRLNNRLTVSQNGTWMNGGFNNTFGGRWSSNRISFSIDNQVYVSPVAAEFGQKSVFQAWNFSIRLRTPHGTMAHIETTVDPFGKNQWGGYMTGLQYHGLGSSANMPNMQHVTFSKYAIQGKVENEQGTGVWGITMKIGEELVMSDDQGKFFMHVRSPKPIPLMIAMDSSVQMVNWTVISAPTVVQAGAGPIKIVVHLGKNKEIASR